MKSRRPNHLISTISGAALTRAGLVICCLFVLGNNVSAAPATDELRAKAKDLFGPLPSKMPACDADTPTRVELGRKLYFDKRLSLDNTVACNSCHGLEQFGGGVDNQ